MVRLKDVIGKKMDVPWEFQFHYGTIKSSGSTVASLVQDNFNSTMVRLKDI